MERNLPRFISREWNLRDVSPERKVEYERHSFCPGSQGPSVGSQAVGQGGDAHQERGPAQCEGACVCFGDGQSS